MPAEPAAERISRAVVVLVAGASAVVLYLVINAIVQSGIQPKIVGDSVGLSATLSFVSLIFWAFVLGAWGALLAIPLSLFFRALLVDVDARSRWVVPLLSGHHDDEEAAARSQRDLDSESTARTLSADPRQPSNQPS
jgi:AI-2 transport protein TqsA